MSYFNKEKDEQLINAVKTKPVLYLARHPESRNCIAKYHAWNEIRQTLDIPIPAIKKRWKHLRDHYKKKLKITKNNAINKWEYMPLLGFLAKNRDMDIEMSSGVDDDRTDNEDIVIKIEEYSGSEHSNFTDNVNILEGNDDSTLPITDKRDTEDDVTERTESKRNFEALNLPSTVPVTTEDKPGDRESKKIDIKEIKQRSRRVKENCKQLQKSLKERKLKGKSEVAVVKKRKYTDEQNLDNGDEDAELFDEKVDEDDITEDILHVLDKLRKRINSILTDVEKCVEVSAKRSGVKAKAEVSPLHRFFEAVADIVALLPPHLVAEARLNTCSMINELEKHCF